MTLRMKSRSSKIEISGLQFVVPAWLEGTEDRVFEFCAAVIFAMYHKCGGADAVLILDGVPPVAVLNPCSLAPLQDEAFADIVSDVSLRRNSVADSVGRKTAASQISSNAAVGSAVVTLQRTIDRIGMDSFAQAFDIIYAIDYNGSKTRACSVDIYFNAEKYRDGSATYWLQMIQAILRTEALNTKSINEIDVLDADMKHHLLSELQPVQFDETLYNLTAQELFQASREQHTDADSVCILEPRTGRTFTYEEVETMSDKIAVYLQTVCKSQLERFGVDAACALHMPRCAEWYVWMLGVLKAGAAYLSLDPDFPANRLSYILEDSGAVCLITLDSMQGALEYSGPVIAIDNIAQEIEAIDLGVTSYQPLATPTSPMYMIYTSGSTGKPKGVLVEHRNLVNFVISERKLFRLENRHRVIQGFSTSFDASLEEIWLAFASGSVLICVSKAVMQDAEQLQELITETQATVLSTVPTLLATMEAPKLQQLELVIVGGEACNKEVLDAYATGGKRMFVNSYGPTEATVACCAAFCRAGDAVTIGRAQPGYVAYVVDESMQLVPPGVPGELCIGGPSVTRGYVNRPELTREKFVHCPFHPTYQRMYRTGDLCRWNLDGNIEFLGRIDSQVKLRGFRIEIGEIETNLATFAGVTTAVVVLRNDAGGMPFLCAYLICEPQLEANFSEAALRNHLKSTLPSYMIPTRYVAIKTIPRSPAGKLDRNGFPAPPPPRDEERAGEDTALKQSPTTETEKLFHDIWCKHLPGQTIGIHDNFFEIGGHSLLAGKVSSDIRKRGFEGFSIRYLYSHPTIETLAQAMDSMKALRKSEPACTTLPFRQEPSIGRRVAFSFIHLLSMHAVFTFLSMYVVLFLWIYNELSDHISSVSFIPELLVDGVALSVAMVGSLYAYAFILTPIIKWTIIGRFREGIHSIWSWYFIRWWVVRAVTLPIPLYVFSGTSWANLFLRLLGAKIGRGVTYFPGHAYDYDLLDIGDDTSIGHESMLAASEVVDSLLILRPIKIGAVSSIGARCCVKGGAVIGSECRLEHLTLLHENVVVGDGEEWSGSPAQNVGRTKPLEALIPEHMDALFNATRASAQAKVKPQRYSSNDYSINDSPSVLPDEQASLLRHAQVQMPTQDAQNPPQKPKAVRLSLPAEFLVMVLQLLFNVFLMIVTTTPVFGGLVVLWTHVDSLSGWESFVIFFLKCIGGSPVAIAALMLYTHLVLIILRWIVLPWHVKPGHYPVTSLMFHRKIFFDLVMRVSLTIAHPLYASIYVQFLLKALGAEVGTRVECSNLFGFTPGLVKFGDETFVADFVCVNPPELFRGVMSLGRVEIGNRAFVGNGAVLSSGRTLHERSLLGLLSHSKLDLEEGSTYIGSPAFSIPRQAQNAKSSAGDSTYQASCGLVLARCLWEFFRCVTPMACFYLSLLGGFVLVTATAGTIFNTIGFLKFISAFVWISSLSCLVMIIVIKWLIVGREVPAQYPLWSTGVWKAEFVVDCTTVIGIATFLNLLRGTPLMPWFFRALGSKIGSWCYIDTVFLTEPDMVTMGDHCCIGERVTIQTHLFEDRIMKIEPLLIGDRVSIGALSIVLYNTTIERGCTIGPLSLVMKGESYPSGTHWEGVPAQRRPVPSVMAAAPISIKVAHPRSQQPVSVRRSLKPSSVKPQANVDVLPIKEWLLDDGLPAAPEDVYY